MCLWVQEAVRWWQWWWDKLCCEHCPAPGRILICSPNDLVATLVTVFCSLENYIILTLMRMQSICIKRTILRVNCAILCFPLKKTLTTDSKNVQTSVAVAPPVQYKDVVVLPVPLPSAQCAGSWLQLEGGSVCHGGARGKQRCSVP